MMISSGLMWDGPKSIEMNELTFLAFWSLLAFFELSMSYEAK